MVHIANISMCEGMFCGTYCQHILMCEGMFCGTYCQHILMCEGMFCGTFWPHINVRGHVLWYILATY